MWFLYSLGWLRKKLSLMQVRWQPVKIAPTNLTTDKYYDRGFLISSQRHANGKGTSTAVDPTFPIADNSVMRIIGTASPIVVVFCLLSQPGAANDKNSTDFFEKRVASASRRSLLSLPFGRREKTVRRVAA